jgi:lipoprotein-anchoring transpeptidase ErfK/SrfK
MRGKILLAVTLTAALAAITLSPRVAQAHGDIVTMKESCTPGTIIVNTAERRLYYVTGWDGQAVRYPVGAGRAGKQWSGTASIAGKYIKPDWAPPAVVRHDHPNLPNVIPGGSPRNPMGVAALVLSVGE